MRRGLTVCLPRLSVDLFCCLISLHHRVTKWWFPFQRHLPLSGGLVLCTLQFPSIPLQPTLGSGLEPALRTSLPWVGSEALAVYFNVSYFTVVRTCCTSYSTAWLSVRVGPKNWHRFSDVYFLCLLDISTHMSNGHFKLPSKIDSWSFPHILYLNFHALHPIWWY